MPRLRGAPAARNVRQALKEKTNTSRVFSDDGNTEGLVKSAKRPRGRPKKAQANDLEIVMTGALVNTDQEQDPIRSNANTTTDELTKSNSTPPRTAQPNKRPPRAARKIVPSAAQQKVLDGMKQRMAATAHGQRETQPAALTSAAAAPASSEADAAASQTGEPAVHTTDRSEYSISASPRPSAKLSSVKSKRASLLPSSSVARPQATSDMETSMLALQNFKRRPRQPSMLAMVQQRMTSARPSVAHASEADDPSVFDLDFDMDDGDEDDFAPEAEGTPLHTAKSQALSSIKNASRRTSERYIASARKRKSDAVESSTVRLSKKRKQAKSIETSQDEMNLELSPRQQPSERSAAPRMRSASDVQVINSPSSTPPTDPPVSSLQHEPDEPDMIIPSTEREQLDSRMQAPGGDSIHADGNDDSDGTMAEPASSSPLPQAPSATQVTDYLADPSTQISPVKPAKQPKKKSKPVSTATLQSMLPKRRQPPRSRARRTEYDMESASEEDTTLDASHLEVDEDELGGRLQHRKRAVTPKTKSAAAGKKSRPSKAAVGRKSTITTQQKKGPKTYGRAAASDKENEGYEPFEEADESTLPEVSVSMQEAATSKELEDAKRKFAEVDDWDMEFESMSVEDHRTSSQTWR